ncbi:hypothetical protein [Frigoribacterium sp. UYMn621]|uniref:hypothetical protein n=1 Tax=Frigoribacterium sp. UYMn621 TaxID=3156343 RepID=UPI00339B9D82
MKLRPLAHFAAAVGIAVALAACSAPAPAQAPQPAQRSSSSEAQKQASAWAAGFAAGKWDPRLEIISHYRTVDEPPAGFVGAARSMTAPVMTVAGQCRAFQLLLKNGSGQMISEGASILEKPGAGGPSRFEVFLGNYVCYASL